MHRSSPIEASRRPIGVAARLSLRGALAIAVFLLAPAARGEIFVLKSEGQVRGELVNPDQAPRKTYEVRTPGGGRITLDANQVEKRMAQSPAELEYDRLKLAAPDTVDGQWQMSEWCRDHNLLTQRKTHLERIIEMEPDHKRARMLLGYVHLHGQWTTQEEDRIRNGYVKYKGAWKLPQEIALIEDKHKEDLAQREWFQKLKRWREWLGTNRADMARSNIAAIDDPYATKALAAYLNDEVDRDVKTMYIDALAKVNTPDSLSTLARSAIWDDDEEIRLVCVDRVARKNYKPAVGVFVQALKNADNGIINRAGVALGQMKDPSTIGPLIDAVVTSHKFEYVAGNPGQTTATFPTGGNSGGLGGMSFGSPPVIKEVRQISNPAVLTALVSITGIDLGYNPQAWKYWLAGQKKTTTLDARRD